MSRKGSAFAGLSVAITTPFKDGEIDIKALGEQVEFQIAAGTTCLCPVGTTGESPTLSHEEHKTVIAEVVQVAAGRIKVMAGTGSNSTSEALSLTKWAADKGADAALLVAPYYNKPTQVGLYQHYKALAEQCDIPLCVYNIPGRSVVNIEPETIVRLAEFEKIQIVKEATGSLDQASQIIAATDLTVLSGDDSLTLPLMSIGAEGCISVVGNIVPKAMIELGGKPILRHIQDAFTQCSIKDMTVVVGYKPETVHLDNIKTVDHPEWEQTGNAYSLYKAIDQLEGPVVISYGDLVFEPRVLTALLDSPGNIVLSVDTSWSNAPDDRSFICSVRGDRAPSEIFGGTTYSALEEIGYDLPHDQAHGEWIGMIKLTSEGSQIFAEHLRAFFSDAPEERMKATLIDFIGYLREQGVTPSLSYSRGHWFDLDGESDLRRYDALHGNAQ